jgi:NAD(P)H-flavin reductase
MRVFEGRIIEISSDRAGQAAAWVACPRKAVPDPGQYLQAWSPTDVDAPLGTPLFPGQSSNQGFLAVAPIPPAWEPGTELYLRGPLGHGFRMPGAARRLALAAVGGSAARLLPLAHQGLQGEAAVALFTDAPLPALPTAMEAYPLSALPESLAWADFLALDLPVERLASLRGNLGLKPGERLPGPAQALVAAAMPCAGLAECGACAVPARRAWKLACRDGPVFDLNDLDW